MNAQVRIAVAAWLATILGAVVLTPVFSGPFLLTSGVVCAAVTGAGIGLQLRRAPRFATAVVQAVVLAEALALTFLRPTLWFGALPRWQTVTAFADRLGAALGSLDRYRTPLPATDDLTLMAVAAIGLVGLLIHVIAAQLRQAAWAGLLLLVMYTVPAATVAGGLPLWLFVPPAAGYIFLLSAEARSRVSRWGRRIPGAGRPAGGRPIEGSAVAQAGRRIGLTVIATATLLPAALPGLPEGVLTSGFGNGSGRGGTGASVSGNPTLDMGKNLRRGDNAPAFDYRGDPTYFRMATLDILDGTRWQSSSRNADRELAGALPTPPGYGKAPGSLRSSQYRVQVSKELKSEWVPLPYPPRELDIKGDWRYNPATLDVLSTRGRTVAGLEYDVTAYDIRPTERELRASRLTGPPDPYSTHVPASVPPEFARLAADITASAGSNQYQQAVLLQRYLRDGDRFTYRIEPDREIGMAALRSFLFEDRTGYCVQFAASMTLLARTLGIPARLAIGFLPGRPGKDGTHEVKLHDMHAWPELYFQDIGWVRFEPTPPDRATTAPAWTRPAQSTTPPASTTPPRSADRPSTASPTRPARKDQDTTQDVPAAAAGGGWWDARPLRWTAGALGILLVMGVPWLTRCLVRRRRFAQPAGGPAVEGLWAEVRDTARDLRLPWPGSATPRQLGDELCDHLPRRARIHAIRLARGVERVRYAGGEGAGLDLHDSAGAVRSALWRTAPRSRRWRARLLPPSWSFYLSRGSAEASDLLDRFDLTLARVRTLLSR